jgi:hypothetical protein
MYFRSGSAARVAAGSGVTSRRLSAAEQLAILGVVERERFFQLPHDPFGPSVIDGPMRSLRVTVKGRSHEVFMSSLGPHLTGPERALARRALRVWIALEDFRHSSDEVRGETG